MECPQTQTKKLTPGSFCGSTTANPSSKRPAPFDKLDNQGPATNNGPATQATSGNVQEFQREYLKSVVMECMDEFTSEVRKQLWHIEWEITGLRTENEQVQQHQSDRAEQLMMENQLLREENESLKRTRHFH